MVYFLSVEDHLLLIRSEKKIEQHGSSVFHFYVRVLYFIAILAVPANFVLPINIPLANDYTMLKKV